MCDTKYRFVLYCIILYCIDSMSFQMLQFPMPIKFSGCHINKTKSHDCTHVIRCDASKPLSFNNPFLLILHFKQTAFLTYCNRMNERKERLYTHVSHLLDLSWLSGWAGAILFYTCIMICITMATMCSTSSSMYIAI